MTGRYIRRYIGTKPISVSDEQSAMFTLRFVFFSRFGVACPVLSVCVRPFPFSFSLIVFDARAARAVPPDRHGAIQTEPDLRDGWTCVCDLIAGQLHQELACDGLRHGQQHLQVKRQDLQGCCSR